MAGVLLQLAILTTYTSPNHESRNGVRIAMCVIHATAGSLAASLHELTDPKPYSPASRVSAHYVIDKGGRIFLLVAESEAAWHAGKSTWPHVPVVKGSVNACSIGVELVNANDGVDPYPDAQIAALVALLADIRTRHPILTTNIAGHAEVAPGRKTDPRGLSLPAFRAALTPPVRPPILHGLVLTHAESLDSVEAKIIAGHHTTLKVIAAWGLPRGWTDTTRARACALTNTTLVRTFAGDPSSGQAYPHSEQVFNEIAPWYQIRRHNLLIEIGNEPNSDDGVDVFGYSWHLERAISVCRESFPLARLIAPALVLSRGTPQTWMQTAEFVTQLRRCDLLGVHAYAYRAFDDTGQLALLADLYGDFPQPLALTEYGINAVDISDTAKGTAYAQLVQSLPAAYAVATYYHADDKTTAGSNNAAYALDLSGDTAYGRAV